MSVKTLHPSLTLETLAEWQLVRDAMGGEESVKKAAEAYLPMPGGFKAQSDGGRGMYAAYRNRAQFPELLKPSVGAMIGIIHGQEIPIDMPEAMNYLWEDADGMGLPLEAFHKRITRELLTIGAYAVLTDMPEEGGQPWLAGYRRDAVINWDEDWFVLDETGLVRDGFTWENVEKHRVLKLDEGAYSVLVYDADNKEGREVSVRGLGGKPLPRVPFCIGNSMDISAKLETPPLIGVANAAKAIYQLSADYRHQLYMSGQETLVAINGDAPEAVGAGVVHEMQGGEGQTPDLKYVSPTCSGIEAHKKAMEDNREAAVMAGARLFEKTAAGAESGEAKRLRYASETATLVSIAQASCQLLERALRNAAMIMGLNEAEVVVNAPTDLMDRTMSPQDFAALFGVYAEGGMSWETLHENGLRGGIYSTERTAEQEAELLDGPMGQENVA
ncbi:hypothetical protein HME9302_00970 [Alteripontixanthobacter maritimus]|uniref:DUF4055 domain-containing protein n=1 Tax=Alteripontixanthobacter maritimus TaxID=2161824 RepID=A0A369Q8A9_9SPHN|nr:DUF4055 domain-containing protein [Alteripontixanthobacter maritimus]RDC59775.1 hypothetical protein HME9302_00970 [Alteripontixanthobacter maritimus]